MAGLHNQLSRGSWTKALQAVLGVQRPSEGIERYGETMQAVVDIWSRPEFAFLRQEHLFGFSGSPGVVAGQQAKVAVTLPLGSLFIAVVTHCAITADGAVTVRARTSGNARAIISTITGSTMTNRDQRTSPRSGVLAADYVFSPPGIEAWSGNSALSFIQAILDDISAVAGTTRESLALPYVIKPGGGFVCENTTAAQAFSGMISGYVRVAMPGEL